jgi:hypothetical protein
MSDDGTISITIEGDDSGSRAVTSRQPPQPTPSIMATEELSRTRAELNQMRNIAFQSRHESLQAQHAAAQREADAAEIEHTRAYENGDSAGMIAAQRRMARAEAASMHAERMKAELENACAQAQQASVPSDPVEAYAAGRTHRTASWIRQHPDYVTDSRKHAKLQAAHYDALSNGHAPDSDSYFSAIEKYIGGGTSKSSVQRGQKRTSNETTVRETATGKLRTEQGDHNTVYLSKREVEIAESLGLSLQEYIRRRRITDTAPEWQRMGDF